MQQTGHKVSAFYRDAFSPTLSKEPERGVWVLGPYPTLALEWLPIQLGRHWGLYSRRQEIIKG